MLMVQKQTKAKKELGWIAKQALVDMCRDAWRFEKGYEV